MTKRELAELLHGLAPSVRKGRQSDFDLLAAVAQGSQHIELTLGPRTELALQRLLADEQRFRSRRRP